MRTIITILSLALSVAVLAAKPTCKVDIDRSSTDSLALCLPGVGKATAMRIDSARRVAPIASCAGLDAVKGLGPSKLAKICPLIGG